MEGGTTLWNNITNLRRMSTALMEKALIYKGREDLREKDCNLMEEEH